LGYAFKLASEALDNPKGEGRWQNTVEVEQTFSEM
jgi:hypothetical protein